MSMCARLLFILAFAESSIATNSVETKSFQRQLDHLTSRLAALEAKDASNQREIQSMKTKIDLMERYFKEREEALIREIVDLRQKLDAEKDAKEPGNRQESQKESGKRNGVSRFIHVSVDNSEIRPSHSRRRRYENDAQVAFFATVTPHDVTHLGANQSIVFDNAVTNIGNAYHHLHGVFTAPVDGVYVFSTTICGRHISNGTYYAYLDVNGAQRVRFVIHAYEQSSHTVIVQLKAGDDVSVNNSLPDDALVGNEYTSFSGFLLYQQYPSGSSAIVG